MQCCGDTQAWLQQAVAERGVYDPALHTTKAALVAALLGASTAARPVRAGHGARRATWRRRPRHAQLQTTGNQRCRFALPRGFDVSTANSMRRDQILH
jgi:hypothetical protein